MGLLFSFCLRKTLLIVNPYSQVLLAAMITSLANSGKHMFYFQVRVEQSEQFYHLLSFSSYYGARPQPSRTVSRKQQFAIQCIPTGYPETHAPFVPKAQTRATHSTPIAESRSSSKLGLQAPTLETRSQYGAQTYTFPRLQSISPKRAEPTARA